jgi:hypothetical protein
MGGSGSKAQQQPGQLQQGQAMASGGLSPGSPELIAAQQELEALTDMYTK